MVPVIEEKHTYKEKQNAWANQSYHTFSLGHGICRCESSRSRPRVGMSKINEPPTTSARSIVHDDRNPYSRQ